MRLKSYWIDSTIEMNIGHGLDISSRTLQPIFPRHLYSVRALPKCPRPTPGAEAYNAADVMFWHDLVHDGIDPSDKQYNFRMLRAGLPSKLAFVAASMLARPPEAGLKSCNTALRLSRHSLILSAC